MNWSNLRLAGLTLLCAVCGLSRAQDRLLLPGDTVRLVCAQDPRLDIERTIDENGTISVPQVGSVPAILMGVRRFEALLSEIATDRLGCDVIVTASEVALKSSPVRVLGLIKHPFSMPWKLGTRISEVIRDASVQGGADVRQITLSTPDGASRSVDILQSDLLVQPGDRIVLGASQGNPIVIVVGPLLHPGVVPATKNLTLREAIEAAGGLSGHADAHHISVRHSSGATAELDLDKDGQFRLDAGDAISVAVTTEQLYVTVEGDIAHAGLVEFRRGMTLSEAVAAAGGPVHSWSQLVAIRRIMDKNMRTTRYDLSKIKAHLSPDPVLEVSDLILVGGS